MHASLRFDGKTALVVGGTSGIGNGIAQAFRAAGAKVHVWGTRAHMTDYSAEAGSDLAGLQFSSLDATDAQAVANWRAPFERLDVLVLSQGTVEYGRAEFEENAFRRVVDLNLNSVMTCCQRFHPALKAAQGRVVIVSSVSAFKSAMGNPAYAASKAGAVSLTRSLGVAWARDGIRVNGIAPGLVDTKLTRVTTRHPDRLNETIARIPARRMGTPGDMAGAALFLASPLVDYIVGQTLVVDGGLSA